MLARPKGNQGFAVPVADLKGGRALAAGRTVSLVASGGGKEAPKGKTGADARKSQGSR
jgi:hypothetical protein